MKNLIPVLAVLAVLMSFAACEVEDTYSPRERMQAFIDDANASSWSDLKAHTHPEAAMYDEAGDPDFWSNEFEPHQGLDNLFVNDTTATFTDAADTIVYTARLREDADDDYKIYEIDRDDGEFFFSLQQ